MSEKRPADPNATIQIDLSQIQLEDIIPGPVEVPGESPRSAPPPLPPALPIVSVPPPRATMTGKTVAKVAIFAVLLVAAIVAGLVVGARVRGTPSGDSATPAAS